jgi:hypothetical protein
MAIIVTYISKKNQVNMTIIERDISKVTSYYAIIVTYTSKVTTCSFRDVLYNDGHINLLL